MEKVKYINNKELLAEIHHSKMTYCSYLSPEHTEYDIIVGHLDDINSEVIETARAKRAARAGIDEGHIPVDTLVFRVMTAEHIPLDPGRKRGKPHARTTFPPFKHYTLKKSGARLRFTEVLRSHWRGDFETGHFDPERGRMTRRLAEMFMLLVERYSRANNFRGYTYVDEMRGSALVHLSQVGLQFDESKSNNPFAFFTTVINHCFKRTLELERKSQHIRDEMLIIAGANPSYTRQVENEMEYRAEEYNIKPRGKVGRKKKASV